MQVSNDCFPQLQTVKELVGQCCKRNMYWIFTETGASRRKKDLLSVVVKVYANRGIELEIIG